MSIATMFPTKQQQEKAYAIMQHLRGLTTEEAGDILDLANTYIRQIQKRAIVAPISKHEDSSL
jgi:hypothetical protein